MIVTRRCVRFRGEKAVRPLQGRAWPEAGSSIRDDLEDALEEGEASDDDDFSVEEKRILRNLS